MRVLISTLTALVMIALGAIVWQPASPAGAETVSTIQPAQMAGGAVTFEADYNDGNKRITKVRCINNGTANARATVIDRADNTIVAQTTFLAGQTTQINLAGQAVTFDEFNDPSFPYRTMFEYPAS